MEPPEVIEPTQPPTPAVPEPAPESTPAVSAEPAQPAADGEAFSWQASEYIHHAKGAGWYLGLAVIVVVLIGAAVLTKQWFAIAVFIAMFVAVAVYAHRPPRTLSYTIDSRGITIDGKLYPFSLFRSFGISPDVAWHTIDLEPTQRFSPRQTILFEEKDLEQIVKLLGAVLPREDRHPDAIERAARYLRF